MSGLTSQFLHEELYRGNRFSELCSKVVVVAGTGAIGSWTALLLARMGVKNFRLIDKDRVQIYNVSTQSFTPRNVKQFKVRALQEQLYRINKARCELHPIELNNVNASVLLKASHLVICSFDNKASRLRVKETCLANKIPCVFGAMDGKNYYFEIIWCENYHPPDDPPEVDFDPCYYPLAAPLCLLTSSMLAEISVQYLLEGIKSECRISLGSLLTW